MKVFDDLLHRFRKPETGQRRLTLCEVSQSEDVIQGTEFVYHILDADSGQQIGRMELRLGHDKAIEFLGNVGYSIRPQFRGHHYAAAACRLLAPIAQKKGMDYVTITCDTDNTASRKTIESLGAKFLGTLQRQVRLGVGQSYVHEKYNYRWELTDKQPPAAGEANG